VRDSFFYLSANKSMCAAAEITLGSAFRAIHLLVPRAELEQQTATVTAEKEGYGSC